MKVDVIGEKFRELDEKKRNLIMACGIGIILFGNILFFLSPLLSKANGIRSDIAFLKSELNLVEKHKADMPKLRDRLDEIQHELSVLEERTIRGDLTPFLKSLSNMAGDSEVNIQELLPAGDIAVQYEDDDASTDSPYVAKGFEIRAEAGFHELGDFVNKLENYPIFVKTSGIKINANRLNPRKHKIFLKLRLVHKEPKKA